MAVSTSTRYRAVWARLRTALLRGRKLGDRELSSSAVARRQCPKRFRVNVGVGVAPSGPVELSSHRGAMMTVAVLPDGQVVSAGLD